MANPFECKMFGDCCKNIKDQIEKTKLEETPASRSFIEKGDIGIGVFDWEYDKIMKNVDKLNTAVNIIPFSVLLSRDNELVVVSWSLNHSQCPFLSIENKCNIYAERPALCHGYPLSLTPKTDNWPHRDLIEISRTCRCVKEWSSLDEISGTKLNDKGLFEVFGDSYLKAKVLEGQKLFLSKMIGNMEKKGMIISNYLEKEEMHKKYQTGYSRLLQFVEKQNYITREEFMQNLNEIEMEVTKKVTGA